MKKLSLLLCLVLLISSCVRNMDPFEGGDGIRVNFNGHKCVMLGIPGESAGASYSEGNTFTFDTGEILMLTTGTQQHLRFRLRVSDDAALVPGQRYHIGGPVADASIRFYTEDSIGNPIQLKGWVSFLKVGPGVSTTEARFELDAASGGGMEFRHGFLRLYTHR